MGFDDVKPTGGQQPILVQKVKIHKAIVTTGWLMPRLTSPLGLGVRLLVDIGHDFYPRLDIYGQPKRRNGELDWGGAYPIRDLRLNTGTAKAIPINKETGMFAASAMSQQNVSDVFYKSEDMESVVPEDQLEAARNGRFLTLPALEGKEILRLSYAAWKKLDGSIGYADWMVTGSVAEGEARLRARFSRENERGYPSNYHPEYAVDAEQVAEGVEKPNTKAEEVLPW
jgi:hypothetical protein